MITTRSYSQLQLLSSFEERFEYLSLKGTVGEATFGSDRYVNQKFYRSTQWRNIRNDVIVRDEGLDLGIPGYVIHDNVLIHHMNPISMKDFNESNLDILDPEYLISVSLNTHNAIHYGDLSLIPKQFVERQPGDTRLW